jgi:hypothetical protein
VAFDEGIPVDEQRRRIAPLIRQGVLPNEIYELGLYRSDSPSWHRYVYNRESAAFNEERSLALGSRADVYRERDLLSDKQAVHDICVAADIPFVPTRHLLEAGDAIPRGTEPLFVKPRSAFGGQRAYAILPRSDGTVIRSWRSTHSRSLDLTREGVVVEPTLVQPLLRAHPCFEELSHGAALDVPTLRIITVSPLSAESPVWHSLLELARSPLADELLTYYSLNLDQHGMVTHLHIPPWLDRSTYVRDHAILDVVGTVIPQWLAARESVIRAHALFPHVHSIAWDVALTDEGPLLLEGNTAFAVVRHQALRGPLLPE